MKAVPADNLLRLRNRLDVRRLDGVLHLLSLALALVGMVILFGAGRGASAPVLVNPLMGVPFAAIGAGGAFAASAWTKARFFKAAARAGLTPDEAKAVWHPDPVKAPS
jgi:hypothetical protein